jgi:hypothetical protein
MPTIRTVVSDLYHNRVRGVGGGFAALGRMSEREFGTVSAAHHVERKASPARFSFGMNSSFSLVIDVDAADYPAANGFVLFFEEALSTVATLTRAHRIVGGGGYSGCLYSVYRTPTGDFKCVHTARPGTANANTYVNELQQYAALQHWVLIRAIPTAGLAGNNGCVTTFFLTRVSYNVNPVVVRTVRLQLNANGLSVGRDRWNDPS